MLGHWLNKTINGASNINRWQGRRKLINRNDAEHMWGVSLICDSLARLEKDKFNNKVNIALLLEKAIYHDCLEIETGDILSGVKRKTNEMKNALNNVETIFYKEKIETILPKNWTSDIKQLLLNPKDNTIEGKILSAADSIDALVECIEEVKLGNQTFLPYLSSIAESILEIDLQSSKYFIKNCLVDFGLPPERYGTKVRDFILYKNVESKEKKE